MITTNKNYPQYSIKCSCGREINFASNQAAGHQITLICECFNLVSGTIPNKVRGQRKQQIDTIIIRESILNTFNVIRRQMTVRQVYYQLVSKGVVEKTDDGYKRVQGQIKLMRQEGILPYVFVADSTGTYSKPESYHSLEEALKRQMQTFRLDVWRDLPVHVEIWLEKDALRSIFLEITSEYDVPLFVSRGFSSESFVYQASEQIKRIGKPTYIYYFSDWDPDGIKISNTVRDKLPRFGVDVNFVRAGLNEQQITEYDLPTRPTKRNTNNLWFSGDSCDLDAMHPDTLVSIVRSCIFNHLTDDDLYRIEAEESAHRAGLNQRLESLGHG